jgi:hypothetical protein
MYEHEYLFHLSGVTTKRKLTANMSVKVNSFHKAARTFCAGNSLYSISELLSILLNFVKIVIYILYY